MSHQQNQQITSHFILQSKTDNQKFTVDQKVIDASTLLKNICDITDITEPITINCPGPSLEFFISFINQRNEKNERDKKCEKSLFDTFTEKKKEKLIKLIQDLCILDSDFFLDSVADYILGILGESKDKKEMDWKDIQKYLGVESDFTEDDRDLILESEKLEYFLSIDTTNFIFPFPNKNLYSLKTDFLTPMNALLARIIQRSNAETSWKLSLINKTIKNEIDRHPIKLSEFWEVVHGWVLNLKRNFHLFLKCKSYDKIYFDVLKKRKVIAEKFSIDIREVSPEEPICECNSSEFPISKLVKVTFQSENYKSMYHFDVSKFFSSTIHYKFMSFSHKINTNFKEVYDHLIAKDLSKEIKLEFCDDIFNFFRPFLNLRFYKKENASKFWKFGVYGLGKIYEIHSEFKEFIMKYMEEDGIITTSYLLLGVPIESATKERFNYSYPVSVIKESLIYNTMSRTSKNEKKWRKKGDQHK